MTKLSTMLSFGEAAVDLVTGLIGKMLYDTFGRIIILLLDWLQDIFRGLAGLEGMKINGQPVNGGEEKYDLVFWLVQTDIIQDIFWSMILFSAFLLIIMTVLALVKNTYEEKQKPVWDIISLSFKGLFGFILVPAMIIVGLAFSNILLQAIDSGTSFGNSTKMSTTLFMSSAYDANKVRIAVNEQSTGECREAFVYIVEKTNLLEVDTSLQSAYNALGTLTLEDYDEIATKIDNAFTSGDLVGPWGFNLSAQTSYEVAVIYDVFKMNYLILLAGGCVLIGLFFKMCWGMVGRIFKVCFDFVLIPVACAMTPFDSGKANKSIQGDMAKNVTMAYGTVGALNLYFSILPIVNTIEFNNGGLQSWGVMTAIFQLMISIVGLFSCNAIIKTVNGWFGTGDVLAEGESTFKAFQGGMKSMRSGFGVGEKVKKAKKTVGNTLGAYLGGRAAADKAGKNMFWGGIKSAFKTTNAGKYMDEASLFKNIAAGKKAGKEAYANMEQSKGMAKDSWHRTTDYNDAAKSQLELQGKSKAYSERYKNLESRIATALKNGDKDEAEELQEELYKLKSQDSDLAQAEKGGIEVMWNTGKKDKSGNDIYETIKLADLKTNLSIRQGSLESAKKKNDMANDMIENIGDLKSARKQATAEAKASGAIFSQTKLDEYIEGKNEDFLKTKGLTHDALNTAKEARNNYANGLRNAQKVLKQLFKQYGSLNVQYKGNPLTEDVIKSLTAEEAYELLEKAPDLVDKIRKENARIEAEAKATGDMEKEINKIAAEVSDRLHSDKVTSADVTSYGKGAK